MKTVPSLPSAFASLLFTLIFQCLFFQLIPQTLCAHEHAIDATISPKTATTSSPSASGVSSAKDSFSGKVVVLPIGEKDLENSPNFRFIERIVKRAEQEQARAIVLTLNTPGGLAWETSELMMKVLQPAQIPLYAFVDTKAMSAGALIAASCETIYMAPVSSIGAAGLVSGTGQEIEAMMRKKVESAFTAFMRSVVEERGHNVGVIEAMMIPKDVDAEYGTVNVTKGNLLTLTGKEAVWKAPDGKPLLAKGIATSVSNLLEQENISAPIIEARQTGFELIAYWLAWASPLLILIGIGAIYFEMKTPGFGIGGIVAIIAFSLFFFGNNVAGHLAGYETAALFVLGIVFIIIEIFLVPGSMVFGILGAILVLFGLFSGMIDPIALDKFLNADEWTGDVIIGFTLRPLIQLSLGLIGSVGLIAVLMRYFGEISRFARLANLDVSGGALAGGAVGPDTSRQPLPEVGDVGVASTELRPVGKALFGEVYYEVSARDGLHPVGTKLRVVERQSFQLIVEKSPND